MHANEQCTRMSSSASTSKEHHSSLRCTRLPMMHNSFDHTLDPPSLRRIVCTPPLRPQPPRSSRIVCSGPTPAARIVSAPPLALAGKNGARASCVKKRRAGRRRRRAGRRRFFKRCVRIGSGNHRSSRDQTIHSHRDQSTHSPNYTTTHTPNYTLPKLHNYTHASSRSPLGWGKKPTHRRDTASVRAILFPSL